MLIWGIILFLLTALFGLIIVSAVFKNKPTPKPAVLIHGVLAFISILVLAGYLAAGHVNTLLITSLVLFVLAALGGLTMLSVDLKNKPIPKLFAVVHPIVAIAGIVVLVISFFQTP